MQWKTAAAGIAAVMALALVFSQGTGLFSLAPREGVIRAGAILPLSGNYGYIGEYLQNGLELAKDEINTGNGINGKKLEIAYEDNQADTKQGISAYRKLREQGIDIVITTISGVTLGIAPLAEEEQVVNLSVGTASPMISEAGDYTFRHNLLPQTEAQFLADLIFNRFGFREIGLVYVNADAGKAYKDCFTERFEAHGGKITALESYEPGSTDFKTILLKMKERGVKAVFAASYTQDLGFILKQAKELGLQVQWFGLYDAEGPRLLEIAGNAAEGLVYSHYFNPGAREGLAAAYFENYRQRYGKESEFYAALAYDSLRVLASAIEECSGTNAECVKQALYNTKGFYGVTGPISFDENGDTEKRLIAKTVKNGEFVAFDG